MIDKEPLTTDIKCMAAYFAGVMAGARHKAEQEPKEAARLADQIEVSHYASNEDAFVALTIARQVNSILYPEVTE